jgi:hypothetical protein
MGGTRTPEQGWIPLHKHPPSSNIISSIVRDDLDNILRAYLSDKASNNSHNNCASFVYALASTLLINIVPLGQLTKKFRIDLPFPSVHPSDITVHPVVFHVSLS